MDYFFSRLGRGFRYTATITGALGCGVVIILGALSINTIAIPICGGIALIPMAMVLMENIKFVKDMENLVIKFKSETEELKVTNDELKETELRLGSEVTNLGSEVTNLGSEVTNLGSEVTNLGSEVTNLRDEKDGIMIIKNQLVLQNNILEGLLDEATINLNEMKSLAKKYQKTSEKLGENLKQSETNTDNLKHQAEELIQLRDSYEEQNKKLKDNYTRASIQLESIRVTKEEYETQLINLTGNNKDLAKNNKELNKTTALLNSELKKTKNAYEDAKSALKTLLQTTGVLQDLGDDMIKTEQKTEENVGMMSKMLNMFGITRSEELFNKLDTDGNKSLSIDEFVNLILEDKNSDNSK